MALGRAGDRGLQRCDVLWQLGCIIDGWHGERLRRPAGPLSLSSFMPMHGPRQQAQQLGLRGHRHGRCRPRGSPGERPGQRCIWRQCGRRRLGI